MLEIYALEGSRVRLEPLTYSHVPDLVKAASGDRESYSFTDVPADESGMMLYVDKALLDQAAGTAVPFATIDLVAARVVGSTRFGDIEYWPWPEGSPGQRGVALPDAVEIGWTWLSSDAQRTGINREAKLLMLSHAFEAWRVHRVSFRTDARNQRSRQAISRLGAKLDGVIRAKQLGYDGAIRDNAVYSILDSEWEQVKASILSSFRAPNLERTTLDNSDDPFGNQSGC